MLLRDTDFLKGYKSFIKGKVRDIYDLGDELLIVATDRISAFDVIFPTLIPDKGMILNLLSEFWFDFTKDIIGNHMITTDVCGYRSDLSGFRKELSGRSMIVRKVKMINAECIVRGYLEGSGLKEYIKTGMICGIRLPEGMIQAQKLPEPIFTPSTKVSDGHDMNVTFDVLADIIGSEAAHTLRDKSLQLYSAACRHAESKGIILADTKFEFGIMDGEIVAADEMFTPDSSRFWQMDEYSPGGPQKSFDKQFLREYLEKIGWDKTPPAPALPDYVVANTASKYAEAYRRITGRSLERQE
jgi:phosphoribosylaminoimidazole-succinocarboxamide synthase